MARSREDRCLVLIALHYRSCFYLKSPSKISNSDELILNFIIQTNYYSSAEQEISSGEIISDCFVFQNYNMGNAVLMPQFYGIGIKRSPHNSLIFNNQQQPIQVRKLNFQTTYDSEAGSSFFSDLRQSEVVQVAPKDRKEESNELKNTQSSFTLNPRTAKVDMNPEDLRMQIYSTKKYRKRQQEKEEVDKENDPSLINILTGIEDTQSERQAIRQKCSVLYQMGKYAWRNGWISETINYFQDVLKESATGFPENSEEKAIMLSMLGNCYFRLQKYQQSEQKYSAALHVLQLDLQQNKPKCADIHMVLGTINQKLSQFQKAIYHFNAAYQLKKAAQPKSSVDLLAPLSYIALNEIYRGNHYKAVEKYCQTLKINRQIYGSSHLEVARNFYNLGLSLFAVGEYSSWLQYHYQSLRMMRELNLQNHPEYAVWLKWFKNKLRELMRLQSYAQEVVGRSIMMMSVFLSEDEQIQFLSGVKEDIEGSLVREDNQ